MAPLRPTRGARALAFGCLVACGTPAAPAHVADVGALAVASVDASARVEAPAAPEDSGATSLDAGGNDADADADSGAARSCASIAANFTAPVTFSTAVVKAAVPRVTGDARALSAVHEKLARIARGGREQARFAFYGDSNMTRDVISGAFRRAMQLRFGDAGHGFVAAVRPWIWYEHMDVRHDALPKDAWSAYAASGRPLSDKMYGAASIAAESSRGGASSFAATAASPSAPVGKTASRAEIYYLKRPGGGAFSVVVDGAKTLEVSSDAPEKELGVARVSFADGPHKVESVVRGGPSVRLFGTALERDAPGVVVDSLGAGALNFELLAHVERTTRVAMLRARDYDVVVFLLGTNMLGAASKRSWVHAVLADVHEALPDAAVIVMSPPDQGVSHTDSRSNPKVKELAAALRETARAEGVLFWDFYEAMGGEGAIRTFVRTGLGEPDCVHLGYAGASLMGARFASEIMRGFAEEVAANGDAGCAPFANKSSGSE